MVVGCRGAVNLNPRFLMLPEASIKGVALGISGTSDYKEMGAAIVAGIEAGWVTPVINKEYAMHEVRKDCLLLNQPTLHRQRKCMDIVRFSVLEMFDQGKEGMARDFKTLLIQMLDSGTASPL